MESLYITKVMQRWAQSEGELRLVLTEDGKESRVPLQSANEKSCFLLSFAHDSLIFKEIETGVSGKHV